MTDAEMVKAMEICKDKEIPCDDCPLVECGDCEGISRQYFYDRFKQLQSENAELKSSLTHANEECLKWHERAQNLLKDSGGSISGYEKKISDLQSENAALKERLENVLELPLKVGSTVYIVHETDEEDKFNPWIDTGRIVSFSFDGKLWIFVRYNSGLTMWYSKNTFDKEVCLTLKAAEAHLAELKGGNKDE